nr:reverse transcriptase domain-containing protein [Tanacetum cinerariifolium]
MVPSILAEQFELKHSLINMMTLDQFKDLLRSFPHHGFTELHQLDTFYNALNPTDQDSLNSATGGNLLERRIQDVLTIIENKSKVRNSRNKSVVPQIKSSDANSNSSSEIAKLTHAINHQTSAYLTADGNTFPKLRDNIQGYVAAVAVNYNKGIFVYRPPGSGSLPSNTITNRKGKLKSITTRSGIVLDGPSVPIPPPFIHSEEDKRLHINITLDDALILIPKYQKIIKAFLSNKEKLQELANTPLNENYSAVILKKLYEKLLDTRKFFIPCGFNKLKCKALANLGASINLMPLSVWKKLGLPELISTRMTLELANRAICTPAGIASDVFISVGKFTFPANFVIVDYASDPRVPLILGRPFLWTAHALIDVHEIEYLLYHDSILKDSIDQSNLADPNDNLVDTMLEMFTCEHALDYSSPPLYDEYDDDLFEVESDIEYVYNDPFDSKGEKIKESKLLINELDLPYDFLSSFEYDSFLSEDFSKIDALPSTNNEDKVFNLGILIQENLSEVITCVALDKKPAISHASSFLEDFDPPLYELSFFKEVPRSKILLLFSFENEEKVFKPGILTSKEVHSFLISKLSHQGYKVFKINQILKSPMKIFLFSCGENIHILDVHCLHFYPLDQLKYGGIGSS